jgi:hypothetical protein
MLWSGVRLSLKSLADFPKLSFLELRDRRLGELWDLAFVPNVTRLSWFSNAYPDVTPLPRLETLTHLRIPRHSALDTRVIAKVPRPAAGLGRRHRPAGARGATPSAPRHL